MNFENCPYKESFWYQLSEPSWTQVDNLGGNLRAKGLHHYIVFKCYSNLFKGSKYKSMLKFIIFPPIFDLFLNRWYLIELVLGGARNGNDIYWGRRMECLGGRFMIHFSCYKKSWSFLWIWVKRDIQTEKFNTIDLLTSSTDRLLELTDYVKWIGPFFPSL